MSWNSVSIKKTQKALLLKKRKEVFHIHAYRNSKIFGLVQIEGWKKNRLMIGRCYLKLSQKSEAIKWFQCAIDTPNRNTEDEIVHQEAKQLLDSLKHH